jgi:signal transduction histidine kinase
MPFRNSAGEIIGTFGISKDISKIKAAEAKLEQVHKQLLAASHQAGRAEVATSVLHNVGNVLNSVNVSSLLVAQKIRNSKIGSLGKMASLLQEQNGHLTEFVANDPRGKQLPEYLSGLAARLANEQRDVLTELDDMNKNVEHIKEIVAMQQSYARISGVAESAGVIDLVEDAIRMNVGAMERHSVQLVREYSSEPVIMVEKHKVLQILVNLIRNAKYALDDGSPKQKLMTLKVGTNAGGLAIIQVMDNGIGIPQENLTRIFAHGFTTRKDGHGFGLHSGALAAKELGGSLTVESAGIGHGATFTLELPLQPKEKAGA